jgi:N6-adenosine-specific RNA methylase IME4
VTFPLLQEGLDTIKAWGFEYKTIGFNWVKWNKNKRSWFYGLGSYTRSNSEICLIATKGNGLPREDMGVCSVIDWPVMAHSKKPDIVRKEIVRLLGDVPRIELFAREYKTGWDCFGNEV